MPNWNEVLLEIHQEQQNDPNKNPLDTVRRKYLKKSYDLISNLKDRSRMHLEENGSIRWMGNKDQGPTFLEEENTISLFRGVKWYVVPSDWD